MKYFILLLILFLLLLSSCSDEQMTNTASSTDKAAAGLKKVTTVTDAAGTTITIDWTTFPDGSPIPNETVITDQFKSVGLVFTYPPGPPRVLTPLGGILISGGPTAFFGDTRMAFIDAGFGLPSALTVEIIGSGLRLTARLEAFDIAGNSLGSVTHTYNGSTGRLSPFTFTAPPGTRIAGALYNGGLNPSSSAASIGTLIMRYSALAVDIDIKPGSNINSINPKSNGVIPVAILTTPAFNAATVDPLSVRFGPAGAVEAHHKGHIEDVDGDGDRDLVLHFRTQATGIKCGNTSASLTGKTFGGVTIMGTAPIVTVGCK